MKNKDILIVALFLFLLNLYRHSIKLLAKPYPRTICFNREQEESTENDFWEDETPPQETNADPLRVFISSQTTYDLFANGEKTGSLKQGSNYFDMAPGRYLLMAKPLTKGRAVETFIDLAPGQTCNWII